MFTLLLSSFEKIINSYVKLDSECMQRLFLLENKIIQVQIIDGNT